MDGFQSDDDEDGSDREMADDDEDGDEAHSLKLQKLAAQVTELREKLYHTHLSKHLVPACFMKLTSSLYVVFRRVLSTPMITMTTHLMMILVMMKSCSHPLMRWILLFSLLNPSKVWLFHPPFGLISFCYSV